MVPRGLSAAAFSPTQGAIGHVPRHSVSRPHLMENQAAKSSKDSKATKALALISLQLSQILFVGSRRTAESSLGSHQSPAPAQDPSLLALVMK